MRRIYVADVVEEAREAAVQAFTRAGQALELPLAVTTFSDGFAFYTACRADPPDLAVAAFLLPGMGGAACCRLLKFQQALRHLPVYLTGWTMESDLEARWLAVGADGCLTKPLEQAAVTAALQALLP